MARTLFLPPIPRRDERGVSITEFALIAPVLLTLIMGVFDIGHELYARSVMEGEMQRAGRASTLETAGLVRQAELDAQVRAQVLRVAGSGGAVTFTREAYLSYQAAQAKEEPFLDANSDGLCNNGESYDDWNGNGSRDLYGARANQGNARDAVIYTAHLTYPRLFPMAGLLGWSRDVAIQSSTVLRNQPYGDQAATTVRKCL